MKTIRVACLLGVMACVAPALADDIIWDGGGVDNNWNTPENWSNDIVPTFFENVFFTAVSSKDCVVTQNQVVFDFTMTAGYTGTLFSSGNPSLTIANDMSVAGGSINWTSNLSIIVERNLAVSGGTVTMASEVIGSTTITGGTVNWKRTEFTGNVFINGGTVSWNSQHTFLGDYTRTGGTVNTTTSTNFFFRANAPQAFTVGAGGIALQKLQVDGGPLQVLDITGDFTGTGGSFNFSQSSTTNLNGTITPNSSGFQVVGSLTTFNVLNGSVVDATGLGGYFNSGRINEIGTGKVLRAASVGFSDSMGAPVGSVPAGTDIFITLFDEDENIDGTVFDTAEVTVTSLTTGDVETITVTETGNRSEEFRNTAGLPTAVGAAILGDGILQQNGSEDLLVSYVDNEDPSDSPSTNLLAPPVVWDGGGLDNNWNTPQNWSTDTVPVGFTSVLFDATSTKNCVVTQNQQALHFTMTAGYAGTLSDSGGRTLTINGDMSVDGGTISLDTGPTPRVNVSGNTTITGGTVDWRTTHFAGNMLISGGTVTWGPGNFHNFLGDYTRTGGTVNTTTNTWFRFNANAPQTFTVGAGGITLRFLAINGGSLKVLDITGDITISALNTSGNIDFRQSSTTNLNGTLTLNPGTELNVLGSSTTLNVLDGSVVNAVSARSYRNDGMINEIGTGVVLRDAAGVGFTDSAGVVVGSIPAGTDVFITLFDEDENIDGTALDTVLVTVQSLTTVDIETITLSETISSSEEFRNTVGLPTAVGAAIPGDGILQQDGSEDLRVSYVDNEDPGDMISNNLMVGPIVWDGGGVDNNWETPQNWSTDRVPTLFDRVIFDATSSKDCLVTLNQTMIDFTMTAGYAGTLSNSGNPSLRVNGNMSIAGGAINWSSSKPIDVRGNLSVSGGSLTIAAGRVIDIQVNRDTTITGGTVNWVKTWFGGDVLINGGSVTWGSGTHTFLGDYTRIGGTVNTLTHTRFEFKGNGAQAFTIGAGGIALRGLIVDSGSLNSAQVLDITGDITIDLIGTIGFVSFRRGTTNLDGRLTLNSGNKFTVSDLGSLTTLNVLDGAVLDATAAGSYINEGTVNEIGTGKVLRFTTGVGLTESTGMIPVNKIDLGGPIFLLLFDEDENIDGTALDFAQVTLTNMINGDFETVSLTERGVQSEDFFFAAGFPTVVGAAIVGNGILEASLGNVIEICYQDDEDPADRLCVFKATTVPDCNSNGVDDLIDISMGTSQDCDSNLVPDECQLPPIGDSPDCNNDQIPDLCQIMGNDCNNNGIPDDCESFFDCNLNGVADACDLFDGISLDCNLNGIPDECDLPDCDGDGSPDECEPDCDNDGIPDDCELDCNGNGLPEDCETFIDCNINGIPDECDIAAGTSADCNGNNIPDGCEIAGGSVPDCNSNGIPDGCDIDPTDPDGNGLVSPDVNGDGIPDECEALGACCLANAGACVDGLAPAQCQTIGGFHQGAGTTCGTLPDSDGDGVVDCFDQCPSVDDAIFAPGCLGAMGARQFWRGVCR